MIINPAPPVITSPVLADNALAELRTALLAGLTWLDAAYGPAEKREGISEAGARIIYPAVFAGSANTPTDYLRLFPDEHLGNFCYFELADGQQINWQGPRQDPSIDVDLSIIFWFDFRTVYPSDHLTRTIEHVKDQVLDLFRDMVLASVTAQFDRIFTRSENIYRGYTISEIEGQFLMRPYGGFRVDGSMNFENPCP